jgi:hypothetical protein
MKDGDDLSLFDMDSPTDTILDCDKAKVAEIHEGKRLR